MKEYVKAYWALVIYLLILIVPMYGWANNILLLAHSDIHNIDMMMIIRAIGIFVAPLGCIMGFIS